MINEYCEKIGIPQSSDLNLVYDKLERIIGVSNCQELEEILDDRYNDKLGTKLYKFINQSLDASLTFFGGYDATFLRELFKEILQNKDRFGKRILDFGCNNGVITCFIAMCCPEATVVGIDSEAAGIRCASELAQRLGLTNVEFQQKKFAKLKKETFDTIVMVKVLHELTPVDPNNWNQPTKNIIIELRYRFQEISKRLSQNLTEGGLLFSVERLPYTVETYSYCLALNDNGLALDTQDFKKIEFVCNRTLEKMPLLIAVKSKGSEESIHKLFIPILNSEAAEG